MSNTSTDKRDNFPKTVTRKLGERAHYICSNPNCMKMTIGPHDDADKSTTTGVAAHIHGAKDGSKSIRYDPSQTSDERRSIENGIWLCHDCSDMIDKDYTAYPATLLKQWKKTHEVFIKTLQQKGSAATLELLRHTTLEMELAKSLIDFFDDRRVIFELFELERPSYALHSVNTIRAELNTVRKQLGQDNALYKKVEQMQKACKTFMTELSLVELDTLKYNPSDPDWVKFVTTLTVLRKVISLHISQLANLYTLRLSDDLQSIVPTAS
jgi:hypothetical protein